MIQLKDKQQKFLTVGAIRLRQQNTSDPFLTTVNPRSDITHPHIKSNPNETMHKFSNIRIFFSSYKVIENQTKLHFQKKPTSPTQNQPFQKIKKSHLHSNSISQRNKIRSTKKLGQSDARTSNEWQVNGEKRDLQVKNKEMRNYPSWESKREGNCSWRNWKQGKCWFGP